MNKIVQEIEKEYTRKDLPIFKVGDKICVNTLITTENKNKNQNFEGVVISKKNKGLGSSFTVRKLSYGEGVEKVFKTNNPNINWIKIIKLGIVRKSKIYYIRKTNNKLLKIKEKRNF